MPFKVKRFIVKNPNKAFMVLENELGFAQHDAQKNIGRGRLMKNGVAVKKPTDFIEGEMELIYFEPISKGLTPLMIEDKFVVFDKPSGVLMHPQNRRTPYSLIDELKYQFGMQANITHRIDQETSGLVLCAREKQSEISIKMQFENREIKKKYLALVKGHMQNSITVNEPLLRKEDPNALVRMMVKVDKSGKESKTFFKPLHYYKDTDTTLVECTPITGRQHQIRVHLFHVKHPIVGDPLYGQSQINALRFLEKRLLLEERVVNTGYKRLLLHAFELEFTLEEKKYTIHHDESFKNVIDDFLKGIS